MRFPPSFLDEIKARLPVSEVVRRRVKLQKAGREWKGLSPFGTEKTPSFFVNDSKMAWFDFSSGKNGNVFDFVMETEGLTFPETVERLAQDAGLPLPERSVETERQEKQRAGLYDVLEWAAAFFEAELKAARGAKARAYLDGRAIADRSRAEFRIGYAPADRHALRDALAAKGAAAETMCEAGLLIHGDDIPVPYDRFRDRVMFPITDRSGRVIAFGGRALEKDVSAKYLNSPETPVFHKGALLFNHHRARKAAHDKGRVIAVEGYIDVVAMHAAGFAETVAGLGTAMTEDQLALLWQMAPEPILCFDGDKAGRKAAFRAAETALPSIGPARTLAFALLPEGQDPDDLIRASGASAMTEALSAALPFVDLIWTRETDGRTLTTPEQRAGLEKDLRAVAMAIRDESLRGFYQREFKERVFDHFRRNKSDGGGGAQAFRPGTHQGKKYRGMVPDPIGYLSKPVVVSSGLLQSLKPGPTVLPPREALILQILLAHPQLIEPHAEDLAALDFASRELAPLRDKLLDLVHDDFGDTSGLRAALVEAGFVPTLKKLEPEGSGVWYLRPDAPLRDAETVLLQALTLHRKSWALHRELLSAEMALATDASEANMARMRDIQEQLSALPGTEAIIEGFGASLGRTSSPL